MENTNVQDEHTKAIQKGLNVLNKVFNKNNVEYRVLGSVLVASLKGKPHRTLGDIDVLVDEIDYEKTISNLRAEGYTSKQSTNFVLTG